MAELVKAVTHSGFLPSVAAGKNTATVFSAAMAAPSQTYVSQPPPHSGYWKAVASNQITYGSVTEPAANLSPEFTTFGSYLRQEHLKPNEATIKKVVEDLNHIPIKDRAAAFEMLAAKFPGQVTTFLRNIRVSPLVKDQQACVSEADFEALNQQSESLGDLIKHAVILDPMTKLLNKEHTETEREKMLNLSRAMKGKMAVFLLDVDYFKQVNHHYGYPIGDKILKEVSRSLDGSFRRNSDLVGRVGGEEFSITMPIKGKGSNELVTTKVTTLLNALPALGERYRLTRGSTAETGSPRGLRDGDPILNTSPEQLRKMDQLFLEDRDITLSMGVVEVDFSKVPEDLTNEQIIAAAEKGLKDYAKSHGRNSAAIGKWDEATKGFVFTIQRGPEAKLPRAALLQEAYPQAEDELSTPHREVWTDGFGSESWA